MKTFLFIFLFFMTSISFAGEKLTWEASKDAEGYVVYYNDNFGNVYHKNVGSVLEVPLSDLNLMAGIEYTFTATAYNGYGESEFSEPLKYTVPIYSPAGDIIPEVTFIIPKGITSIKIINE